jgi:hypothetical protein
VPINLMKGMERITMILEIEKKINNGIVPLVESWLLGVKGRSSKQSVMKT